MTTVKDVIQLFETWVPVSYAESWDNVGLQLGRMDQPVQKVMITLDVVEKVVQEAIEQEVDFIIAHHPLFFQEIKSLNLAEPKGRVVQQLIQQQIAVYAAHTNLDIVKGGVNDLLADQLLLQQTRPLVATKEQQLYKLVIYTPTTHLEQVREAVGNAGAGHIGNYSHCSFRSEGTGAFKPLEGTNPYLGKQGVIEEVAEYRLETIITDTQKKAILQAAKEAHPYEEMAYDVIPLANKGKIEGLGRIGTLAKPIRLYDYIVQVKERLAVPALRYVGDPDTMIQRVAVLGGSGKGFIDTARQAGADLYITGDLSFHEAQDAEEAGICLIDPGHHVEAVMKQGVVAFFDRHKDYLSTDIEVFASAVSTEPFRFA
ncbi:Nif3-like dinuclear metal center hexameric protein [Gracilibacillus alcaliphilus]|uniref:Nif3-like dinuclear metal center hexameric protein n=1 Tax=Gracilibacillus alcaliphilus TaxID=1401441 RepID=UPI00195D0A55|nr:Nif3-like dinuclear metal center hexameric protein [Gracilibacillus alcaliphilus]MBM7675003.1 dinuclear metal center YbgI/SA1388 family protein [Gracilibacillus alcaliphilus]